MITKNFKARMATILQTMSVSSNQKGIFPVKDIGGSTKYINLYPSSNYPAIIAYSVMFSTSNGGIWVGSGNTAASEDDYTLESQITSGLTANTPTVSYGLDGSGNPYLEYLFTLTNSTGSDITVREIGYVQTFRVSTTQGGTSITSGLFLIDRTVLSTPVTVPANDSAAVKYTLKTVLASS